MSRKYTVGQFIKIMNSIELEEYHKRNIDKYPDMQKWYFVLLDFFKDCPKEVQKIIK